MGIARPGDMGFDIVHFNLHKTFTQPHGGGGPGGADRLLGPHRAVPAGAPGGAPRGRQRPEPSFELDLDRPKSIGKLRGFQGNFGVFVRTYAYICSLGGDGLKDVSQTAVLNANYLKALLAQEGIGEYLPVAFDRHCMHEFVLSGSGAKEGWACAPRPGQAHARPPRAPAHRVLPAARGRGAHDRADRDGDEGAARPLRRGDPRDPRRGEGGSRDRPHGAAHDARAPPRRGGRGKRPVVRWRPDAENPGDPERAREAPASGTGAM